MSESCQQRPDQHYDITILSAKCILLSDATVLLTKSVSTFGIQNLSAKSRATFWRQNLVSKVRTDAAVLSTKSTPNFWCRDLVNKIQTDILTSESGQQSPHLFSSVTVLLPTKSRPTFRGLDRVRKIHTYLHHCILTSRQWNHSWCSSFPLSVSGWDDCNRQQTCENKSTQLSLGIS